MTHKPRLLSTTRTPDGLLETVHRCAKRQSLIRLTVIALMLFAVTGARAQTTRRAARGAGAPATRPAAPAPSRRTPNGKTVKSSLLASRLRQCASNPVCLRLVAEYGAVLGADTGQVTLPPGYVFRSEAEVQRFQRRAGVASEVVGGVRVELQLRALKAFLAARAEARRLGLDITPMGEYAARRSYADTVRLWQNRVKEALRQWVGRGRLTGAEAARLRGLAPEKQLVEILRLEERGIYFGAGYGKSVLHTVAAPGASQHNVMLALDVEQYNNPAARQILARHGWFQTVENDAPHFTFLGVAQSELPSRGLRRVSNGGRTFWLPKAGASGSKPSIKAQAVKGRKSHATLGAGVNIPSAMEPLLHQLSQLYFDTAGGRLHITDAMRSPEEQAKAMYNNLRAFGSSHVLSTYGWSRAASEIVGAYDPKSRDHRKMTAEMARIIRAQVKAGIYVSDHLRGRAFDIRLSSARLAILNSIVRRMGGEMVREPDHYHVEFPSAGHRPATSHTSESEGHNESETRQRSSR